MATSEERAARNEVLFREVNGQIERIEDRFGRPPRYSLVCECAAADCADSIEVEHDVYHRVRQSELQFLLAPGHEHLEIERVVERRPRYVIVEKIGAAASAVVDVS